jgi:hypothetical protein
VAAVVVAEEGAAGRGHWRQIKNTLVVINNHNV